MVHNISSTERNCVIKTKIAIYPIHSSNSICCLTTISSSAVRYSSPGEHPGIASTGATHSCGWTTIPTKTEHHMQISAYTVSGNHNKATFNNISAISLQSVLFVRGNRRNPPTCRKSLINFIAQCWIEYTSPWAWFKLTTHNVCADRHLIIVNLSTIWSRPRLFLSITCFQKNIRV